MKSITITFKEDGSTTIEAEGFKGNGCTDATAAYEKALGVVSKRKKKPEYHSVASTSIGGSVQA
jgi:hypothetical protein